MVHNNIDTIHTGVFSFTIFTPTTVFCNSMKDCVKLEISTNNYPGILKIHQGKIRELGLFEILGALWHCRCTRTSGLLVELLPTKNIASQ